MKRMLIIIFIILFLVVGIFLIYPVPQPPFDEIFHAVDQDAKDSLRSFRLRHVPTEISVGQATWHYVAMGEGEQTILFLHGMTGAYDIWWQQLEVLSAEARVISVTYPSVDSLAQLDTGIQAILARENVTNYNVVGSSLGGYFAQYLVSKYPERIDRAIFANTFPPNDIIEEKNSSIGNVLPYLPAWVVMSVLRKNVEENIYPTAGKSELVRSFILEQGFGRMSKAQFLGRFQCVIDSFVAATLPNNSDIPIMLLEADNDPLVEEALREMLKTTYPAATVKTLHNVGHFPYLNEPETYTNIIRDFILE